MNYYWSDQPKILLASTSISAVDLRQNKRRKKWHANDEWMERVQPGTTSSENARSCASTTGSNAYTKTGADSAFAEADSLA